MEGYFLFCVDLFSSYWCGNDGFLMILRQIYPHVATGFSDSSAFLRELTLKSLLVLAPKVHAKSVIYYLRNDILMELSGLYS